MRRKTVRQLVIESLGKRDGWKCGICSKAIEPSAPIHLDHKVSLSNNGADEMENLQLAHPLCNLQKGNDREWPIIVHMVPNATGRKHCPTCTCNRVYASNADRQRAYRIRRTALD